VGYEKQELQLVGMTYAESTRVWRDFLLAMEKNSALQFIRFTG
jgi:hypothetical protein